MNLPNLCADCSRDGNGCNDRDDANPLVHCTTYVSKASVTHPCPLCLSKPPPTVTCRMCGEEGPPFIVGEEADGYSRPEFKVGCDCSAEALRAENQHLRAVLRHIADWCDDDFARDLAKQALQ